MSVNSNLYCLVMAGGQGTRFWPESTSKKPKQYLNLLGDSSLLEQTLDRFSGLVAPEKRFIVTVDAQKKLVQENSKDKIGSNNIIFEPSGRNTAPCILLSIASLIKEGASLDDVVAIVPSDHVILNTDGLRNTIKLAFEQAATSDKIVTIGITPNFPHTGYGYIHKSDSTSDSIFNVKAFKEKPNKETATEYVKTGEYLWNAGMFVGSLKTLINEFQNNSPETYEFYNSLLNAIGDSKEVASIYNQIPPNSIDYAIMEKSDNVLVTPAQFDWNDLGSWDALESVIESRDNNTIAQARDTFFDNATGNIVYAPNKFVSLINVKDLIVVSNDNSVVVLPKADSQKVKDIVAHLKSNDELNDLV